MTALQTDTTSPPAGGSPPLPTAKGDSARRKQRRPMSNAQRAVVAAAGLPLVGIGLTTIAGAVGIISIRQMINIALTLGEEPGMFVFAAMMWCSPVQWLVKRTQVPVRKMLGILFGGYAIANFAMFVVEEGVADSVSRPFLVAGTVAMLLSLPLLATSGRWAQRSMGMKNWRKLHRLTFVIAFTLVLHVALLGEVGVSGVLILTALIARIPPIAQAIRSLGDWLRSQPDQAIA